jgi:hypothetical protein
MPPLLLDEPPPEELLLEELLLEELLDELLDDEPPLDELLLVPPLPDEPPHPTSASMDPSTQTPANRVANRVANRDEFIMMSLIISRTRTLISPGMAAATGTCSTVVFVDC